MNMELLIYLPLSLACAAAFTTLFYAYTLTERAGLERLPEKYPKSAGNLEFWSNRWNIMRIALLICAMTTQIHAVISAITIWGNPNTMGYLLKIPAFIGIALLFTIIINLIPAIVSEKYADKISIIFLKPAALLTFLLYPLAWPLATVESIFEKLFRQTTSSNHSPSNEDAIKSIVNDEEDISLDESERKMIRSVLEFSETLVREIMTPRTNMTAIEDTNTIEEAIPVIRESWHSRIPVFRETLDNIIGAVHVKDILIRMYQDGKTQKVAELTSTLIFVPGSMPINELFERFLKQQAHMAIVLDEYGGTDGLVTLEDVLEELVGDIRDEYDNEESSLHPLHDGSVVVDADVSVSELNEELDLALPEDSSYETIGGLILEQTGKIPVRNEKIVVNNIVLSILESDQRRILKVLIEPMPPDNATNSSENDSSS